MLNALSPQKVIRAAFRHSPLLVFVCCVFITALTLVRSDVLFTVPWPPILWSQAIKLFAVVGSVAAVTAIAAMFFHLRLEL